MKKAKKIKNSKKQIQKNKKINKPSTKFQKIINGRKKEGRMGLKKKEKKSICYLFLSEAVVSRARGFLSLKKRGPNGRVYFTYRSEDT